ncbi:ABC transporter permease subunit [Pseudohalocynthiibacter aestuariivivens]|nr:ABC transporter permease subunit [Pseudohalocynthiibacter aestuariivivens]QIE45311.1 ABC transporter permease subunit [Pseudohalocynthiibacter aestuariivivens]
MLSLLLLPMALLLLVYVIPLSKIVWLSIGGWDMTLEHFQRLFQDDLFRIIFMRTVWIAMVVTILSLIIGYPVALLIAHVPPRTASLLLMLVIIPMWTSILVRSYSWMVILGRQGIVNSSLQELGLTDQPLKLLYTRFTVYVGMLHIMLPFMVLPILNTMRQIPPLLGNAALTLGAGPLRTFWLVYFPLSLPGVVAGCTLVAILSLGFFVTPALLGGAKDTTFVLLIDRYVRAIRDWEMASAMSIALLMAVLALVLFTQFKPAGQTSGQASPGKLTRLVLKLARFCATPRNPVADAPSPAGGQHVKRSGGSREQRRGAGFWSSLLGIGGLLFLSLPLVIIIVLAFSDSPFLKFPPTGFSLRWFENFLNRPDWINAAWTSLRVGLMTMVVATFCGSLAAIALERGRFKGRGVLYGILISPLVVPVIVLAIAVYFVFAPLGLVGTQLGLVLAHSILAMPFVIIVVTGALKDSNIMLENAARTLGASPIKAFLKVTLPTIRPGVAAAALFAFLASFDELVIALFIAGTGSRTLPKRMWEGIREEIDPTIAAVAAILIALTLVLIAAAELIRNRSR